MRHTGYGTSPSSSGSVSKSYTTLTQTKDTPIEELTEKKLCEFFVEEVLACKPRALSTSKSGFETISYEVPAKYLLGTRRVMVCPLDIYDLEMPARMVCQDRQWSYSISRNLVTRTKNGKLVSSWESEVIIRPTGTTFAENRVHARTHLHTPRAFLEAVLDYHRRLWSPESVGSKVDPPTSSQPKKDGLVVVKT